MKNQGPQITILNGFEDPGFSRQDWNELLGKSKNNIVFLTWEWQKAWWEAFGRGELLLILANENETPILLAPLFADHGMVYFVGSGGSDYLDFIGDSDRIDLLTTILSTAAQKIENFKGFLFYHLPEPSGSARALGNAAQKLNLTLYEEGSMTAPFMSMEQAESATCKKSLLRHENWFRKSGVLNVKHLNSTNDIIPYFPQFFEQHISRWKNTSSPSLFADSKQCYFYKRISELANDTGWLRFTVIEFNGLPVAFHFGFHYNNSFMWYKPSFDMSFARHSPGEVLLRQLIIQSMNENAVVFDFGLGEEEFKKRFLTGITTVQNWGLVPPGETKSL